jgi:adenosylhomocysteine nucleosidase
VAPSPIRLMSAPPSAGDAPHRFWLVCVATSHELRPLKRSLNLTRSGEEHAAPIFHGCSGWNRLSVLQTGVGPTRAQQAVAPFLDRRFCRGVISVGLSGGLRSDLTTGTLVVGDRWALVEGDPLDVVRVIGPPADGRLKAVALRAAVACGLSVHEGRLATADHVVGRPEEKHALSGRTDALAVDMESGAIAEVALAAGVAVVAVRAILDPLDEALTVAPDAFLLADGSSSIWKSGLAVAARPMQLPALWRVGRQSRLAMALLTRWLSRFWDEAPAVEG